MKNSDSNCLGFKGAYQEIETPIFCNEAKSEHGISVRHSKMLTNNELRFRMNAEDGSAYIRTVTTKESQGWQNAHYHKYLKETYLVEKGWIGYVEKLNDKIVFKKFKSGEIQVMCNVMVLTHGFDYPELSCVIMACPTKSLTKYFQCIGRGTRVKENYNDCIILDIVDVCKRHKLVNTWTLDRDKPAEEKTFITEKKRQIEIEKHKAEIESFILSQKDEKIDLFEVPKVNKSFYSDAFKEPASEKQIKWLSTLGYDVLTDNYTKGMASKIIGSLPATDKQLKFLHNRGYKVSESLTRDEAQACFDDINIRNGRPTAFEEKKRNQVKNLLSRL